MKYTIKTQWNGSACLREMTIHECNEKKEDLTVIFKDKEMVIPYEKLYDYDYKVAVNDKLKVGKTYDIYYYKWNKFKKKEK